MKFETPLHQAKGLGSAKSGLPHWILQRITAIALIPLGIWFVGAFILFLTAPFDVTLTWFSSPWAAALSILFIVVSFYHGCLGLQVIWEDYIPNEFTKWILIIITQFFSVAMALLATLSIFKILLGSA